MERDIDADILNRFAQICKALIESGIGASDFASFFLPRLAPLAYDLVVNVRIAASRTIGTIYTNGKLFKSLIFKLAVIIY